MDPEKRERLRKNHVFLKENLQILPLLDHMLSKGIFDEDDESDVRSQKNTPEKCQRFLEHLRRKGNDGYSTFCDVLKELRPDILKTIEETKIDRDALGEPSPSNIFYNPSEDYELKGLIDELTKENKISAEQLDRIKNLVIDEIGCPEELIEPIPTSMKFFRHLMKSRLITRYNLSFLQSLLWRVGLKTLCLEVAKFARQYQKSPVHFYTPLKEAENGYTFGKFHIQGNYEHFEGITIEEICLRVARYLGVPPSQVIPVGVQPSESLILTIMLPTHAMETLVSLDNWSWLTDFGVDYIVHTGGRILTEDKVSSSSPETERQILEKELKRKMESEQHLKQCLYDEQISNENLKDMQVELEKKLQISEETMKELNTWYMRIFSVLLVALHFIAELLKDRFGLRSPQPDRLLQQSSNYRFKVVLEKAKRWSSNHESLMQLVDATKDVERCLVRYDIDRLSFIANASLDSLQKNLNEAITVRMTERSLGVFQRPPTLDEFRQTSIVFSILSGLSRLDPILDEMLADLVNRLDEEELERIYIKFNVPKGLQTKDLKAKVITYIIFSELDKQGKHTGSSEDIGKIIEGCFKEARRKDLWDEYEMTMKQQMKMQQEQRDAQSKKDRDINDRLEKMEKMMETLVGQRMMGNLGLNGFETSGPSHQFNGFSGPLKDFVKSPIYFQGFGQDKHVHKLDTVVDQYQGK